MSGHGVKSEPVLLDLRTSADNVNKTPHCGNINGCSNNVDSTRSNQNGGNGGRDSNINGFTRNQLSDSAQFNFRNEPELAVLLQDVCKSYEDGKPVLSNLSMNVERGTIYGLLGSSGCGKTTLLSCIVGLKKWDRGQILLFGKKPNGAPGRKVGFMPQHIALYDQLSIREMIGYYGRLYGMADRQVHEQWLWLVDFLQLPAKFKLVKDLSGGQKRRVSLAITLVHSPDLLILDEPTVGLDPLLRESIWQYLLNMVKTRRTTVLVTTHYIEEARYSNTIGVMREGRMLVEDSPTALRQQYQCDLLETVVLRLCRKDQELSGRGSESSPNNFMNGLSSAVVHGGKGNCGSWTNNKLKSTLIVPSSKKTYNVQNVMRQDRWDAARERTSLPSKESNFSENESGICDRVRAMSTVIWIMFYRHPLFMLMLLILPTLQLVLTLAVIGTHPNGLKFGVVNGDEPYYDTCFDDDYTSHLWNKSCDFKDLSCSLINQLSKTETLKLVPISSEKDAIDQVHNGELWGFFSFPENYSTHLQDLIVVQRFAEDEALQGSRVSLRLDMSNYLGAAFSIRSSFEAYEKFAQNMAISCGMDPREFSLPFEYRKPVFWKHDSSYQDYVMPIVIMTVIFEVPMLVTSMLVINDRKQQTFSRAWVAGLHFKEVMISHFLTQGTIVIAQTLICAVVMFFFYNVEVKGEYWLYYSLCILSGLCGESLGLFLGVLFDEELESLMFGIFLAPILLMYEGVVWPVEGMRPAIRAIAYLSPTTLAIESMRSVAYRGVGLWHAKVWPGITMMSGWTIAFWIVSISLFIKKNK